jgi:hypothetical protein
LRQPANALRWQSFRLHNVTLRAKVAYHQQRHGEMFALPPGQMGAPIVPIDRVLANTMTAFDPDAIKAMTTAYDSVCAALHLLEPEDPLNETIAKKIIERAKRGELDALRLCEAVLEELRSSR